MTSEQQPSTQRLFTAIPLPSEVRRRIAGMASEVYGQVEGVRWVPEANLHVTLRFLGQCSQEKVPELAAWMEKAALHLPETVRVGGVGGFPSVRSARVIWVGVDDETGDIEKVYNVLDKGAGKCGFGREGRKYRPHITVGRARRNPVSIPDELVARFAGERFDLKVEEIVLFRSVLSGAGAEYSVIERAGREAAVQ